MPPGQVSQILLDLLANAHDAVDRPNATPPTRR